MTSSWKVAARLPSTGAGGGGTAAFGITTPRMCSKPADRVATATAGAISDGMCQTWPTTRVVGSRGEASAGSSYSVVASVCLPGERRQGRPARVSWASCTRIHSVVACAIQARSGRRHEHALPGSAPNQSQPCWAAAWHQPSRGPSDLNKVQCSGNLLRLSQTLVLVSAVRCAAPHPWWT